LTIRVASVCAGGKVPARLFRLFAFLFVLHRTNWEERFLFVTSVLCQSPGFDLPPRGRLGACIFVDIYKRLVQCTPIGDYETRYNAPLSLLLSASASACALS
jgi:hypothetical protein